MEIDDGTFRRIDHRMNPAVIARTIKLATGPTTSPGSRTTPDSFWLIVCATMSGANIASRISNGTAAR